MSQSSHSVTAKIRHVRTAEQLDGIRNLFREYANWLGVCLCFQSFEQELAALPGAYHSPDGGLWLATLDGAWVGCVGVKPLGDNRCELKRLYVKPEFQNRGIGKALLFEALKFASRQDYSDIVLDTLERLKPALCLYHSVGFRPVAPYYDNPNEGVVYLGLKLDRFKFKTDYSNEH